MTDDFFQPSNGQAQAGNLGQQNSPLDANDIPSPKPQTDDLPQSATEPQISAESPQSTETPLEAGKEAQDPEESYNAFIDQLIVQLGFDKLEGEEKEKLSEAIKQRVEARILRTLMMSLTKEQQEELDKQIQSEDMAPEAIIKLLSEKAPNASDKIMEALDDLYQEMKEETDTIFEASSAKVASEQEAPGAQADQSVTAPASAQQPAINQDNPDSTV